METAFTVMKGPKFGDCIYSHEGPKLGDCIQSHKGAYVWRWYSESQRCLCLEMVFRVIKVGLKFLFQLRPAWTLICESGKKGRKK